MVQTYKKLQEDSSKDTKKVSKTEQKVVKQQTDDKKNPKKKDAPQTQIKINIQTKKDGKTTT